MIEIHLSSFFIGVVVGFLLLGITICAFYTFLTGDLKRGYQPVKSYKPSPPKIIVGIGSKGEDA